MSELVDSRSSCLDNCTGEAPSIYKRAYAQFYVGTDRVTHETF